jgi:hypothetical protein
MLKFSAVALWLACLFVCPARAWSDEPADAESAEAPPTDDAPDNAAENAADKDDGQLYDLKYKFEPGEVLRSEIVHRAAVQTTIDGTTQKAETQSKSIKIWRINDVTPEGNVTFVHMVESIDMWQRAQGRTEIHYNSRTDREVPPGYEDVAKAVGVPLTVVTMDNRGKILKRVKNRPQPASVSTQMTMPLADHPISVGQTWSSPIDIEVVLKDGVTKKIRTRQKFTLEKVVDGVAAIAIDSQILTPVSDPAIEAQLIQRLSAGSVRFDIETGRVLGQQLDLDRHVIGFSGAASSMHYVTRFTEEALPPAPAAETARRAAQPGAASEAAANPPAAEKRPSRPKAPARR